MPALATVAGKVVLLGQRSWPYLLLARFAADKAAPLGSPLAVDVGTLAVTDASSILSQSGGALVMNGTPAANSGLLSPATYARVAGRALLFGVPARTAAASTIRSGWDAGDLTATTMAYGIDYTAATTARIKATGANVDTLTVGSGRQDWAVVMRATGAFLLLRDGATSGPYKLLWVYATGTAAEFAKMWLQATSAVNATLDDFRVVDLGGAFASDFGIATSRNAGAVARGTAFDCAPDAVVEWVMTTLAPTTQADMLLRFQDTGNCWIVRTSADGSLALLERIAAVSTSRASAGAGTVAAGNRVVTIMDGSTIKVYVADVLKLTYSSASSLATQRGGTLSSASDASAVVSDVVAWPRTISLPQGA